MLQKRPVKPTEASDTNFGLTRHVNLTPQSTVLLEKLIVCQPVKKFSAFYEIRNFIAVLIRVRDWTYILSKIKPVHDLISLGPILILSSSMPRSHSYMFSDKNCIGIFYFCRVCYILRTLHYC
jgi:hypothetical protein